VTAPRSSLSDFSWKLNAILGNADASRQDPIAFAPKFEMHYALSKIVFAGREAREVNQPANASEKTTLRRRLGGGFF
jgi:hypothetical protein